MNKPLADLIRPTSLEEMVGQTHLLGKDSIFRKAMETKKVPNMIFYGPAGTGKTTMANIIQTCLYINLMVQMPQLMISNV